MHHAANILVRAGQSGRGVSFLGLLALAPILFGGCDPSGWSGTTDRNVGLDPILFPGQRIQGEPNDGFSDALDVVFDSRGRARLAGTIIHSQDVDVYALGPLQPGDRLIIDVGTPGSLLDPMIAVFDDQGRIVFENDDRNYELGQYDPFLNQVVRHESSMYFLAIARAPLSAGMTFRGSYDILITRTSGNDLPAAVGQVVVLDFDGGTVTIPDYGTYHLDPFDAADIDPIYAGKTAVLRQLIADCVRENYEGLNLDVRVVPGDSLPGGAYSSIFFGGRSSDAFGVAESIDPYNADRDDDAIVFTGMFTSGYFSRTLTIEELGIAIGNVASHELGHLFGLNHVADTRDLMDTTGGAHTLLADQEFLTDSPLDDSVFPIGLQDAWLWLLETLGPDS